MKGYDTADYARSRLAETIVRKGDSPIMVVDCRSNPFSGNIDVTYDDIMTDSETQVCQLTDLNLDPVPLGYVNWNNKATYITRMPMRKDWRQGARMLNLVDPDGFNPNRMNYRVIGHTIMGKFPSLKSVLDSINTVKAKLVQSEAFHRDFCVGRNGSLHYKGLFTVGVVDMTNGSIRVDDRHGWVREAIDEAMETAA